MIIGLGSDLCDARRIEKVLERHGERFLDRIFTPAERAKAERRANRVETYAKRFAAKEACSKALGTGIAQGVFRPADPEAHRRRPGAPQGDHPAGLSGDHRRVADRRGPHRPGHRHHLGGPRRTCRLRQ